VHQWDRLDLNILTASILSVFNVLIGFVLFFRQLKKPRLIWWQFISFLGSFGLIIMLGPLILNYVYREAQEVTFAMYMMLAFLTRAFQFKIFAILITLSSVVFVGHGYAAVLKQTVNLQTYVVESIMNLVFVGLLVAVVYTREMRTRKSYNSERIIEVEIRRTEEMLNKLVPEHALAGIKNDSKVIDILENVTILYARLVGFEEYYRMVQKPKDCLGLLSRLYSKFDILCEQNAVYKVNSLCDTYVVIGYRGKIAGEKRTTDEFVGEAYNMLQVAQQICDVVRDERNKLKDPILSKLDVKVGLNTGKIVAGIIGTKVVRYDIFGQDVLISNLIMRQASPGSVLVSNNFRKLINKKPFIYDTFDWQAFSHVTVPDTDHVVQTYSCD